MLVNEYKPEVYVRNVRKLRNLANVYISDGDRHTKNNDSRDFPSPPPSSTILFRCMDLPQQRSCEAYVLSFAHTYLDKCGVLVDFQWSSGQF